MTRALVGAAVVCWLVFIGVVLLLGLPEKGDPRIADDLRNGALYEAGRVVGGLVDGSD